MRQMINEFVSDLEDPFVGAWTAAPWSIANSRPKAGRSVMTCMRLDAYETDTGFHVHCECAGVPKDKIDCSIENNILHIKIKKEAP